MDSPKGYPDWEGLVISSTLAQPKGYPNGEGLIISSTDFLKDTLMDSPKGYPNGEGLAISSTYLNVFFLLAGTLRNLLRIYIPSGVGDWPSLPLNSMYSFYWLSP